MTPLPAYSGETLAWLAVPELLELLERDEDRVPRNVIDECARRGEEMVRALERLAGDERLWREEVPLGEWWLRLHAAMILGLIASAEAGSLLVSLMRRIERTADDSLQGWLSGYWPAVFRNKPGTGVPALRALAEERSIDWYMRIQAVETVLACAQRDGKEALEAALDWAASLAADASDGATLRYSVGNKLIDFPRERHRALLERLAAAQSERFRQFEIADVRKAYAAGRAEPHWKRFDDPWKFYSFASIAARQERWAKEDAEANEAEDDFPSDDLPEPYLRAASKIGRNDPCPCGSGRKYKRCCLNKAEAEPPESLVWRRLRSLLEENRRDMVRFVIGTYGEVAIQEAWRRFVDDDEALVEPQTHHLQFFMPWFYHRWSPLAGKTGVRDASLLGVVPTAQYLRRKTRLEPLLREYLQSCLASPFSAFEILRADAGRGLRLKDLFTGEEHEVMERAASGAMRAAEVVFGQLAKAGGVTLLEAAPGFAIPPIHKIDVLEFRRQHFGSEAKVAPERVRALENALIALYRNIAGQLFAPKLPMIQNTDGEPLSPRRVVFDVSSAQEAFDALKHLAMAESDAELLRDAVRDAGSALARVRFSWLGKGNPQMKGWENTVLGTIEIDGKRLAVHVNSEAREQRLRKIVDKALGARARHRATEIQSAERMLAEAPARTSSSEESGRLAELPEVKAKLAEMMGKFYEQWVNEKIPVLGGRTPLQAVGDPDGREAVATLVAQIERDGSRMKPPLDPAIPRRLRERLGLGASAP